MIAIKTHVVGYAMTLALLLSASVAQSAISVETSAFITSPEYFNGFEQISTNINYSDGEFPEGVPYTEGGITVEFMPSGPYDSVIATEVGNSFAGTEGMFAWYPIGGSDGYTDIRLAGGEKFSAVQFLAGNGNCCSEPLAFELLLAGSIVDSGTIVNADAPLHYIGFSGGGFDELRVQSSYLITTFDSGGFDALVLDSIAANAAPEPSAWLLMVGGFSIMGAAIRPRRVRIDGTDAA